MSGAVPELRFPGFVGEWKRGHAGDAFTNRKVKGESGLSIWSVTMDRGLVPRGSLERQMGDDAADELNLRALPGDLVYNMMRMWQGALGMASEDCMVSPAYVVLKPKVGTSSKFFNYWFKSQRMLHLAGAYSHGLTSDRLRLYFPDFAKIPLALPSLSEQRKIADFLDTVSRKIALLGEKKGALEDYKRGLMQRLFSRELRFTRDDGSAFPDWRERRLNQMLFEHKEKNDDGLPVFSVAVRAGLVDQIEHLGRSFAAKDTSNYNRVNFGDVVYTKSPTGHFPLGIIKQSRVKQSVAVSPLYGVFRPETFALGYILHIYFESPIAVQNYLHSLVQKGAKNTIAVTNTRFLEGRLTLPIDPDEQRKIAAVLSALDAKIDATARKISEMETFKKGLLQKLFV